MFLSLLKLNYRYKAWQSITLNSNQEPKVLFTDRCRWQNLCPSLLRLVGRPYTVTHKMQKARMKILPSATVGE